MPRWRPLNHWMQEKRPLERNDTVLCVYNNFIIHYTSLGKWQKGKQYVIVFIWGNFVVLLNIIRCIFAIGYSSRHNEMSKPVFLLHNLKSRYIDFVATYEWLRANNALFMGFPSVSGQCNWFFMLHWLTSCVLMGPVIGLRCWLIRTPPLPIFLQFLFFFNSELSKIDLKYWLWW